MQKFMEILLKFDKILSARCRRSAICGRSAAASASSRACGSSAWLQPVQGAGPPAAGWAHGREEVEIDDRSEGVRRVSPLVPLTFSAENHDCEQNAMKLCRLFGLF